MSNKYDLSGAHVVNKFVWSRLESDLGMSKADYNGLVPIIPTQEVPVFNEMKTGRPFIVYAYNIAGYNTDIWQHQEQLAYTIYSDNETDLRRISNFLRDLMRRYDITAAEINDFIGSPQIPGTLVNPSADGDDRAFEFKYITVISGLSNGPASSENGRQSSTLAFRYEYTRDENNASMRA